MKTLYESLLDDLDDLDAKSDGVIVSDELSKLMSIMMPLYKGNFKTEFHKFYDPKTNTFNVTNMSTVCLYITKHNNNIYIIPCDHRFIHRFITYGQRDDFKENFPKLIELIDSFNIKFKIPKYIEHVFVNNEIKSGKTHNNITLENTLEINYISIPTFSEDTIKWINNLTKEINITSIQYREGVFDLNTDFVFPFNRMRAMRINLPVKIGNKSLPYKTGAGLTNNDKAHECILNFLIRNYEKNGLMCINIYKQGSVFIDGDIILRKNWDNSYSAVYNKV